jgi:superfamily II DNA helicase RecQ
LQLLPPAACILLSYEVVKKSRKAADELAERLLQFVDARGNVQCGIIYCLSR